MYNVSSNFLTAIKQNSRTLKSKVLIGTTSLDESSVVDFTIESLLSTQGLPAIGGVVSSKLTIKFPLNGIVPSNITTQTIKPSIGLLVGNAYEYVPLGAFLPDVESVIKTKTTMSVECFDTLYYVGAMEFKTALSYPATIAAVLKEIETNYGVTFSNKSSLPTATITSAPKDVTVRDVLADIAELTSTNAVMTNDGSIVFKFINDVNFSIDENNYINFSLTSSTDATITGITCEKTDDEGGSISCGNDNGFVFSFKNDSISSVAALQVIFNRVYPLTYTPFTCQMQGMPQLNVGDKITITEVNGTVHKVPILSHKLSYNGGLKSEISANVPAQNTTSSGSGNGSLTHTVQSIYSDMSVVKELFAGNITADNIKGNTITADKLVANTLTAESGVFANACIDKAQIKDLAVTSAKIEDSAITNSKIYNGSITNAKIKDGEISNAKIADGTIQTAKIGDAQITSAKIANGAITNALIDTGAIKTAQIADGSITDAKIVELTANKIKTGTLDVERLIIRGSDKSIVYEINNINGALQAVSTDTINGEVLTERSITADKIVANAITANEIASKTIVANNIAANAITSEKIDADAITGNKIKAGEITVDKVSSNFGGTLDITSNTAVTSKVTQSDVDKSINDLEIGGRNILRYSDFSKFDISKWTVIGGTTVENGKVNISSNPTSPCESGAYRKLPNEITLKKGQKITASAWVYSNDLSGGSFRLYIGYMNSPTTTVTSWHYDTINPNTTGLKSYTYTLPEDAYGVTVLFDGFKCTEGSAVVGNYKLELGDKATDWTIAPEDVESQLDDTSKAFTGLINDLTDRVTQNESSLVQTSSDIKASVSATYQTIEKAESDKNVLGQKISEVQQTADSLTTTMKSIENNGVNKVVTETGFKFDKEGLSISKTGEDFNLLAGFDDTQGAGFYVRRNKDNVLIANSEGVKAENITVSKYLVLGKHSRFEDYGTDRTGCFFIE